MVKDFEPQSGGEGFKSFHLQPKYNLGVLFVYPYLSRLLTTMWHHTIGPKKYLKKPFGDMWHIMGVKCVSMTMSITTIVIKDTFANGIYN